MVKYKFIAMRILFIFFIIYVLLSPVLWATLDAPRELKVPAPPIVEADKLDSKNLLIYSEIKRLQQLDLEQENKIKLLEQELAILKMKSPK